MIRNTRMLKSWWLPCLTWWTSTAVCGAKGRPGCLLSFKIRSQHQARLSTQNPLDFSKIYMDWVTAWCADAVSDLLNIARLGNDRSLCLLRDVRLQVECFYPQLLKVPLFLHFYLFNSLQSDNQSNKLANLGDLLPSNDSTHPALPSNK